MKMITIVCGGRDNKETEVWKKFFTKTKTNLVIAGGACGADRIAMFEADSAGIELKVIKAEWDRLGKGAGFQRNFDMADYAKSVIKEFGGAVQVVAVRGGKGTNHMLMVGRDYGFKVHMLSGGCNE
jgi:hypothetical protein